MLTNDEIVKKIIKIERNRKTFFIMKAIEIGDKNLYEMITAKAKKERLSDVKLRTLINNYMQEKNIIVYNYNEKTFSSSRTFIDETLGKSWGSSVVVYEDQISRFIEALKS